MKSIISLGASQFSGWVHGTASRGMCTKLCVFLIRRQTCCSLWYPHTFLKISPRTGKQQFKCGPILKKGSGASFHVFLRVGQPNEINKQNKTRGNLQFKQLPEGPYAQNWHQKKPKHPPGKNLKTGEEKTMSRGAHWYPQNGSVF